MSSAGAGVKRFSYIHVRFSLFFIADIHISLYLYTDIAFDTRKHYNFNHLIRKKGTHKMKTNKRR